MTDDAVAEAWAELLDAAPAGWALGKPTYDPGVRAWLLPTPSIRRSGVWAGKRMRAWTAVAQSEEGVVRELARCLREISAGPVPG